MGDQYSKEHNKNESERERVEYRRNGRVNLCVNSWYGEQQLQKQQQWHRQRRWQQRWHALIYCKGRCVTVPPLAWRAFLRLYEVFFSIQIGPCTMYNMRCTIQFNHRCLVFICAFAFIASIKMKQNKTKQKEHIKSYLCYNVADRNSVSKKKLKFTQTLLIILSSFFLFETLSYKSAHTRTFILSVSAIRISKSVHNSKKSRMLFLLFFCKCWSNTQWLEE